MSTQHIKGKQPESSQNQRKMIARNLITIFLAANINYHHHEIILYVKNQQLNKTS